MSTYERANYYFVCRKDNKYEVLDRNQKDQFVNELKMSTENPTEVFIKGFYTKYEAMKFADLQNKN